LKCARFDRVEAYACPFTGHVYLTASAWSGPYKDHGAIRKCILFRSTDVGHTWEIIKEDFSANTPLIMTSTPNGRLFLFHSVKDVNGNEHPIIYFSKNTLKNNNGIPKISQGYKVYYKENGQDDVFRGSPKRDDDKSNIDIFLQMPHPAISRISTDETTSKIRLAYQAVNNENNTQDAVIINISVQDADDKPTVENITRIKAEDPANYSVVFFTFIDPDFVDTPSDIRTNISVLYWFEAPKFRKLADGSWGGLLNKSYRVRYMVFNGDNHASSSGYLSVDDGKPRSWHDPNDKWGIKDVGFGPGDYMTGGFFWTHNRLNYLAQWVEVDDGTLPATHKIMANIVTILHLSSLNKLLIQRNISRPVTLRDLAETVELKNPPISLIKIMRRLA
jgi:hypothetical protein